MPTFPFTTARLATIAKTPHPRETTYVDTAVPGLCVRARPGSASYVVRYRLGGREAPQRRYTIGPLGAVGLAEARQIASRILAEVRAGGDPAAAKRNRGKTSGGTTLAELLARHVAGLRARGIVNVRRAEADLRREFVAVLGAGRDVRNITRTEIVELLERIRDGIGHSCPRPGAARTLRVRIYGLLESGVARGILAANPLAGWRRPPLSRAERLAQAEQRAGRMLTMPELAALWSACGDPRIRPSFGGYIKMLVITGARRTEMAMARLSWLRPATAEHPALLVLPASATKAGREHTLPLPGRLALDIIANVPRYADTDLIFPGGRISRTTGRTAAISGWNTSWKALLAVAREYGLQGHVRIHDLRKTARSHWSRIGVQDRVAEALLNHAPADVLIGIYDRRDLLDEKTAALEAWCDEIQRTLEARAEAQGALPAQRSVNCPAGTPNASPAPP